jgi:probable addiction module antidote protein
MPKRTRDYDAWLFQQLTDPNVAANYINAAIEDSTEMLLVALRNVAEAHKMAKVAEKAGVAREALYKALSEDGNPRLETLRGVLKAVRLRIAVVADEPVSASVQILAPVVASHPTTVIKGFKLLLKKSETKTSAVVYTGTTDVFISTTGMPRPGNDRTHFHVSESGMYKVIRNPFDKTFRVRHS